MLSNSHTDKKLRHTHVPSPLSAFAAQSFASTQELFEAVLQLISNQLGMRTSFLTEITSTNNRNYILAAHNLEGGCDLAAGTELPLNETFCSIITNTDSPTPLIIADVKYDSVFGTHPAALASPQIGCFVGVPIILSNGELFGTLCAIDLEPQLITPSQTELLLVLARFVATQIDQDRSRAILEQVAAERDQLYQTAQETLREREALVAIASHELKNPLTALLGQAQLLQRSVGGNTTVTERDRTRVNVIVGQAQRLNSMLTELLDVSQLDTGELSLVRAPIDLYALVERVVSEMYGLSEGHTVTIEGPPTHLTVNADSLRLEQVARNLLSNAIKYTLRGGTITVAVGSEGHEAVLQIRDTGVGITSDALPNLFRRFYRANLPQHTHIAGFGIGLYVVKEIVTRHGGTITVASTEGVGSTFTVRLPLLDA